MKRQKKFFILGIILTFLAILCVTFLPFFVRNVFFKTTLSYYIWMSLEAILLFFGYIFFLFSPKYFLNQIVYVCFLITFYFFYIKVIIF